MSLHFVHSLLFIYQKGIKLLYLRIAQYLFPIPYYNFSPLVHIVFCELYPKKQLLKKQELGYVFDLVVKK